MPSDYGDIRLLTAMLAIAGHAALHLAYVWAWPSGEARTLRDTVHKLLGRSSSPEINGTQPSKNLAQTRSSRLADATQPASPESSCKAQPSQVEEDDVFRDAAPHVKAVLRWSAAPSWSEKQACSHSALQLLGTGFDIAVHIAMLVGHIQALRSAGL